MIKKWGISIKKESESQKNQGLKIPREYIFNLEEEIMNANGFARGMMSKNMEGEKFLRHVADCLEREFEVETRVYKDGEDYLIKFMDYAIEIDKVEAERLQDKGPYSLDKFILEQLRNKGFAFDVNRSHFVKCCFGIHK